MTAAQRGRTNACPSCGGPKRTNSRLCKECVRQPDESAFWARVDRTGGCWEWIGPTIKKGYGKCKVGQERQAHRVAYTIAVGPIPPGLFVCHRCDNRRCCRPDHLFLGDNSTNIRDMVAKGRSGTAKMTPDTVRAMRAYHKASGESVTAVGVRFGMSRAQAYLILTGKAWKDVA